MASNPTAQTPQPARQLHVGAGILSYLVPGLGQIYQRRYAKGILFFVCIYTLFFYGTYIGSGSVTLNGRKYTVSTNVYLPRDSSASASNPLVIRWPFLGQFWVGVAAWPAIAQWYTYDQWASKQRELENAQDAAAPAVKRAEEAEQEARDKEKAGAEDAEKARKDAAEARKEANEKLAEVAELERKAGLPLIGSFQREPSQASINAVHNAGDKRLELAWVFTVIAGVLNILVIYDAVVGPAVHPSTDKKAS